MNTMNTKRKRKRLRTLSYIRTYRRNWGLTQKELADLVGSVSTQQICQYENGKRDLGIEVALACQVIFGICPSTMFRDTYAQVEEEVMRNMYRKDLALENTTSLIGLRKRELYARALKRATHPVHHKNAS